MVNHYNLSIKIYGRFAGEVRGAILATRLKRSRGEVSQQNLYHALFLYHHKSQDVIEIFNIGGQEYMRFKTLFSCQRKNCIV